MRAMQRWGVWLFIIILAAGAAGCAGSTQTIHSSQEAKRVFVSILPQAYFAEQIGGEHIKISVLIPPGADPHTYEPTPQQMKDLTKADLYLKIGTLEFEEQWMERIKAANPHMRIVDTSQSVEIIEGDPHIWLSPRLVKVQAQHIHDALAQMAPDHQEIFQRNHQAFQKRMDDLDGEIETTLSSAQVREFLVFHPSWGYYCRDYGLREIAIEQEGKEPTAQEIARIIDEARHQGIKAVITSPQHSGHEAQAIAQDLGGKVITMDPLARDYENNLRQVTHELADLLAERR